jgi:hypothetical protein
VGPDSRLPPLLVLVPGTSPAQQRDLPLGQQWILGLRRWTGPSVTGPTP